MAFLMMNGSCVVLRGSMMDWGIMVHRGGMMDWGIMVHRCGNMVYWCSSMVFSSGVVHRAHRCNSWVRPGGLKRAFVLDPFHLVCHRHLVVSFRCMMYDRYFVGCGNLRLGRSFSLRSRMMYWNNSLMLFNMMRGRFIMMDDCFMVYFSMMLVLNLMVRFNFFTIVFDF